MSDELTATVRRLADAAAVHDRLAQYCHAIDEKRRDDFLDCFTADGAFAWKVHEDAEWAFEVAGREQLAAWYDEHERRFPPGQENHMYSAPRVEVDGDRARAVSRYFTIMEQDGRAVFNRTGSYRDELVRCEDGRWRIRDRRAVADIPPPPDKRKPRGQSFADQ